MLRRSTLNVAIGSRGMIKRYHSGKQSQPPGRVLYGTKDKGITLKVDKIIPDDNTR
jgi:hypothetical protein